MGGLPLYEQIQRRGGMKGGREEAVGGEEGGGVKWTNYLKFLKRVKLRIEVHDAWEILTVNFIFSESSVKVERARKVGHQRAHKVLTVAI